MFKAVGAGTNELRDTAQAVAADLIIGALIFAKRECEYTTTPKPGKTKMIVLKGVTFRSASKVDLDHTNEDLAQTAKYVTIALTTRRTERR